MSGVALAKSEGQNLAYPEIILKYEIGAILRTLHHLISPYCQFCANSHYSTIVESSLQIGLFLQNKANFCKAKIDISSFVTSK
ncbi:MAG: hypothetical protein A2167_03300 [Planctomycetes bacterium RBG_13_46_10]|nr:MAG: hypothetical protein A2167_03300 [Planctomycetes bacterium RBG_13_46_10]